MSLATGGYLAHFGYAACSMLAATRLVAGRAATRLVWHAASATEAATSYVARGGPLCGTTSWRGPLRGTMSWPCRGLGAAAYAATRHTYYIAVQSSFPKLSKPLLPKVELDTPPRVQSLF